MSESDRSTPAEGPEREIQALPRIQTARLRGQKKQILRQPAFSIRELIAVIPAVAATVIATITAAVTAAIVATVIIATGAITVNTARRRSIGTAARRRRRRSIDLAAAAAPVIAVTSIAAPDISIAACPVRGGAIAAGVVDKCFGRRWKGGGSECESCR
jgi:hypothetical protein